MENKIYEINWEFESTALPPRREHRGYLQRELVKELNQRYDFFNNRIANVWNSLPDEIVAAAKTTTNGFKKERMTFFKNSHPKLLQFVIYCWRTPQETTALAATRPLLLNGSGCFWRCIDVIEFGQGNHTYFTLFFTSKHLQKQPVYFIENRIKIELDFTLDWSAPWFTLLGGLIQNFII